MRRTIAAAAFVLSSIALFSTTAHAKRVALIIGNNAYENVGPLEKAVNDARAMDKALAAIGFATIRAENTTHRQMNLKLLEFASQLEQGDEALFFFAGHGVEIDGRNYLLPTDVPDAAPGQDELIKSLSVGSDVVLDYIRRKGVRVSILILDACRNNPFKRAGTRSLGGTRGLAQARAPEGTFIIYSAGVGQLALDTLGEGDSHPNSVFTRSLIPLLKEPGLSLPQTARKVRRQVQKLAKRVSHSQRPAYYDEVTGDFYFNKDGSPTVQPESPKQDNVVQQRAYCTVWPSIAPHAGKEEVETFLKTCQSGFYADLARARLKQLPEKKVAVGTFPDQKEKYERDKDEQESNAACDGVIVNTGNSRQVCIKPGSGKSFRDCPECPEMVVVPAGRFHMGSIVNTGTETPRHPVSIAKPFAVGKFEVTWDEWEACQAAGGCEHNPDDEGWGRGRRPVMQVSWEDAQSYIKWLNRKFAGTPYRLLTEAEWEYAARAGTTTLYSWGNLIDCGKAAFDGGETSSCHYRIGNKPRGTQSVGSFPANAFGLHDMHGNVREWTEDCWNGNYNGAPDDGSAWKVGNCSRHVVRGGSWWNISKELRAAKRNSAPSFQRDSRSGFRVFSSLGGRRKADSSWWSRMLGR